MSGERRIFTLILQASMRELTFFVTLEECYLSVSL